LMNLLAAVVLYTVIFMRLGMDDPARLNVVMISQIDPGSPAETAGLQTGDVILEAEGVVIDDNIKLRNVVFDHLGEPIELEIQRNGEVFTTTLVPRANPPDGRGPIGIVMGPPTIPASIWVAFPAGMNATYRHGEALIMLLTSFVSGRDTGEGRLLGFKGMVDTYGSIRDGDSPTGLPQEVDVMGFFTNLTVSLGLLNLLPIPALDGGRILLVMPEIILRRRIPKRYQEILIGVTFLLLLGLLILVNVMEFF
jgi:regulator of sigma E protease